MDASMMILSAMLMSHCRLKCCLKIFLKKVIMMIWVDRLLTGMMN